MTSERRPPVVGLPLVSPVEGDIEELSEVDFAEIEELEVEDGPAGPVAVVPVVPTPRPVWTHADRDARAVLVVEDDASIRAMIVRALATQYTVYEADDGLTAKTMLAQIPLPACVVSDWMMPRMDGVALLAAARADPKTRSTPFVLLTAKNAPMAVVEAINAGARGYIAKPFKMKELLDKVAAVIAKK